MAFVGWCGLLPAVEAKSQNGQVRLGGSKKDNRWKYLNKFGYTVGKGTFQFRLQLAQPPTLPKDSRVTLSVYVDEDWPKVETMADLCERPKLARQEREAWLDHTGHWSAWVNGTLTQVVRPHIWFFAVHDCGGNLQNFTHRFRFEFRAVQDDGSEFSVEMRWMLLSNFICLMGFSVFIYYFFQRVRAFFHASEVHPVVWTLSAAMFLQYLAQLLHTLHLWKYRSDGLGIKGLEVLSEILFMLSQVVETSLLILIALGYTLLQSKIGELDLMLPLCFMVAVIHIMLVGFGKMQDDASYKYHENEGAVGWVLLCMRLLLFVWFLWAVQSTAAEGGMRLKNFARQFAVAGSLYFLAYPVIFTVTQIFAPYLQHRILSLGLMAMQMGSNMWLARLFVTKSEYFKVSTLNSSFLPGGARVGLDKEE